MVTCRTIEDVHEWLGNALGQPMEDNELWMWCLLHGIMAGGVYVFNDPVSIGKGNTVTAQLELERGPCFIACNSRNLPGKQHMMFWDGRFLRDPDPNAPDTQCDLSAYQVTEIVPIRSEELPRRAALRMWRLMNGDQIMSAVAL